MKDLTNLNDYITYFEDLARNNSTLQHASGNETFGVIDMAQMRANITFKDWAMVLEFPESNYADAGDAPIENLNTAFWILKKPATTGHADIYAALKLAKELAREIVARIWRDFREDDLLDFDLASVRMNKLGPWDSGGQYGWRVELQISTDAKLTFDDTKWSDL